MFFETETMDEFNIVFSHVKIICPRTPENWKLREYHYSKVQDLCFAFLMKLDQN